MHFIPAGPQEFSRDVDCRLVERALSINASGEARYVKSPAVGIMHGQLRIERDQQTGREFIATHDGDPLRDLTQLGRNEEAAVASDTAEAISPDDLKANIEKQLNDRSDPAK